MRQVEPRPEHADHPFAGGGHRWVRRQHRARALPFLGRTYPAHQEADLAFGELDRFVEKKAVVGLPLPMLFVADVMGGAELDEAAVARPELGRRRAVEAVAAAVDFQ